MIQFICDHCDRTSARVASLQLPSGWLYVQYPIGGFCVFCSEVCILSWFQKRVRRSGPIMRVLTENEDDLK